MKRVFLIALVAFLAVAPASAQLNFLEINDGATGDYFGSALSCRGPRLLIGSPNKAFSTTPSVGGVALYLPASGVAARSFPLPFISIPIGSERFGEAVAVIDDVTGDSIPDYATSAPGEFAGGGGVHVYADPGSAAFSAPFASINGSSGDRLGSSLSNLGDITNDGRAEIIAGAPGAPSGSGDGAVVIIDPATDGIIRTVSGNGLERLGDSVAAIADVTGDSLKDVVAGAPNHQNSFGTTVGRIVVINSASGAIVASLENTSPNQEFGASIAFVGDLNSDGRSDIVVGAPLRGSAPTGTGGQAHLYTTSGANGAPVSLCSISGAGLGDSFGEVVSAVGDVDGDSIFDFAVAAPAVAASGAGMVRIFSYDGSTTCRQIAALTGASAGDSLGVALAGHPATIANGACEFNANAETDFAVGTLSNTPGSKAGSVLLFGARSPTPTPTPSPTATATATPTATPTPVPPTAASLGFRISTAGVLSVRATLDRAPANLSCTYTLFTRVTVGDKKRKLQILGSRDVPLTDSEVALQVSELPKVSRVSGRRPVLHVLFQANCDGGLVIRSNIASRFMSCGIGTGVGINEWYESVNASLADEQA
jgi:hypothetical protein